MKWFWFSLLFLCAALGNGQNAPPRSDSQNSPPRSVSEPAAQVPRSPDESSSKDTMIDISPPKDDIQKHPESYDYEGEADTAASGVVEMKPWNPHKAMKDVEVGDYYARQKNYKAAISRYREALEYKPKDAEATYKLATALEKSGELVGALENYEAYLKILKNGPYANDARKAVERLKSAKSISQSSQIPR